MRSSVVRTAVLALSGLALFSLVFSLAADNGLWPRLPAGALHNTDLWAGFCAGVALLLLLVRGDAQRTGGRSDGGTGGRERETKAFTRDSASESPPSPTPPVSPSETEAQNGLKASLVPQRQRR